jgi:8-oxo-dGTP pyrophosphatase MutT (NUDIX family)
MSQRQSYYTGIKGLIKNSQGSVLILKDNSTGKWEVPGGRIDQNQQIEEAFRREMSEELPGSVVKNFGSVVYAAQGDFMVENDHKLMLLFFIADVEMPDSLELSNEHSELAWVDSSTIDNYEIYTSDKAAIKSVLA